MKRITVRYFAMFREHAGVGEETLELDAATARDVFEATRARHGSSEPLGHCKIAINDRMTDWDAPVENGDTVLLFPPVAGG
ncbi:MAG: MoaD/ThiS family protein [Woeseiaceae bacterium]|jgi:MoaD family protein